MGVAGDHGTCTSGDGGLTTTIGGFDSALARPITGRGAIRGADWVQASTTGGFGRGWGSEISREVCENDGAVVSSAADIPHVGMSPPERDGDDPGEDLGGKVRRG